MPEAWPIRRPSGRPAGIRPAARVPASSAALAAEHVIPDPIGRSDLFFPAAEVFLRGGWPDDAERGD